MSPDVESLIGPLEEAEDAVCRRAPGVPVPRNDAILMEDLKKKRTPHLQSFTTNLTNQVLYFWKQNKSNKIKRNKLLFHNQSK